jgi:hypothetical protein
MTTGIEDEFAEASAFFATIEQWLCCPEALGAEHYDLEKRLTKDGRELMRRMLQAHLRYRARQEEHLAAVKGKDGAIRTHVESSDRGLMTAFGPVRVERVAYRGRGMSNLHPADAMLNLPVEKHSHGLRREVAEEAAKSSFDETVAQVDRHTAGHVGKRQAEELVVRAAKDFEAFYEMPQHEGDADRVENTTEDLLVLSQDGKGIVVRKEDLREATKRAAERASKKLQSRLSQGEKKNRKRMATVAAVYDVAPFERTPEEVLFDLRGIRDASKPRPKAKNKRVWASVAKEPEEVTREMFDEAERRDPDRKRRWVVLVDGDPHQIERIEDEAHRRGVEVTLIVDYIHMLEYLWKAAWCFFEKGEKAAEKWVHERAFNVLMGWSSEVAGGIRRSATLRKLDAQDRKGADDCADYLISKRPYLRYAECLEQGYPIATGVIEGACRHVVKDRMDITGARWSLRGAEAVLRLRSLRSSGDLDAYWSFHLEQERERNHLLRFAGGVVPRAA